MTRRFPPPEDDWWKVGPGKGTCRRCGEDDTRGLISRVEDGRGVQLVCGVCSFAWWVERRVLDVGGHAMTDP